MPILPARARQDGGGKADQLTAQIDQCATGVTRIDGGVRLDEILEAVLIKIAAAQATDNPRRHRIAQAKGITDGDDKIAHFQFRGVAEGDLCELDGPHFEQREIRRLVDPHHFSLQIATVGQRDRDVAGVLDDMRIGEDVALARVQDHAGPGALELRSARAACLGDIEEPIERRISQQRIRRTAFRDGAASGDIDHRRGNTPHHGSQ